MEDSRVWVQDGFIEDPIHFKKVASIFKPF